MISHLQLNPWPIEVENVMIIEDLDSTHSLGCKVSRGTAEEMGL